MMNYKLSEEHYADLEKKVNSLNRHKKASITLSKIGENYEEVQKDFFVKFIELDIEVKSDVDNSNIIIDNTSITISSTFIIYNF